MRKDAPRHTVCVRVRQLRVPPFRHYLSSGEERLISFSPLPPSIPFPGRRLASNGPRGDTLTLLSFSSVTRLVAAILNFAHAAIIKKVIYIKNFILICGGRMLVSSWLILNRIFFFEGGCKCRKKFNFLNCDCEETKKKCLKQN